MARILRPRFATFANGSMQKPRKQKTLGGHALKGTIAGVGASAALGGVIAAGTRIPPSIKPTGYGLTKAAQIAGGATLGTMKTGLITAGIGAAAGAGLYGAKKLVDRFRGRNKKPVLLPPTRRQKIANTYNNLKSRIRGNA